MALSAEAVERAARLLLAARGDHRRVDGFSADCRPDSIADGYAVQDAVIDALAVDTAGYKIACTSEEACRILGADGPFLGRLVASTVIDSPATIPASAFHMRGLEAEFAFRFATGSSPDAAPVSASGIEASVASVHPAIEIVDSRFAEWTAVGAPSLAADNAAGGALVLGPALTSWRPSDLNVVAVSMTLNGAIQKTGSGRDVMGHPLEALAWAVNHLAARGRAVAAGEVVTTGTCTGIVFAGPGDIGEADFGPLGRVTVAFSD